MTRARRRPGLSVKAEHTASRHIKDRRRVELKTNRAVGKILNDVCNRRQALELERAGYHTKGT